VKKKDLSIIIHGPIDLHTIININKYSRDYHVILCSPKKQTTYLFNEVLSMVECKDYNLSIIFYEDIIKSEFDNRANRYYHFLSVDSALKLCNTKYTIKLRSDEYYSNLDPFYYTIVKNNSKIITNDVFFRNSTYHNYHPSDHLVGGRTELMSNIYAMARNLCENQDNYKKSDLLKKVSVIDFNSFCPEQILGFCAITQINDEEKIEKLSNIELMKSSFEIVKSDSLGSFIVNSNSAVKKWTDTSYHNPDTDIDNIENYK